SRPPQDEGREEARHEGTRRREPLHRREDDVQGEAGQQEGPHCAAQEPQGNGQLIEGRTVFAGSEYENGSRHDRDEIQKSNNSKIWQSSPPPADLISSLSKLFLSGSMQIAP